MQFCLHPSKRSLPSQKRDSVYTTNKRMLVMLYCSAIMEFFSLFTVSMQYVLMEQNVMDSYGVQGYLKSRLPIEKKIAAGACSIGCRDVTVSWDMLIVKRR